MASFIADIDEYKAVGSVGRRRLAFFDGMKVGAISLVSLLALRQIASRHEWTTPSVYSIKLYPEAWSEFVKNICVKTLTDGCVANVVGTWMSRIGWGEESRSFRLAIFPLVIRLSVYGLQADFWSAFEALVISCPGDILNGMVAYRAQGGPPGRRCAMGRAVPTILLRPALLYWYGLVL